MTVFQTEVQMKSFKEQVAARAAAADSFLCLDVCGVFCGEVSCGKVAGVTTKMKKCRKDD